MRLFLKFRRQKYTEETTEKRKQEGDKKNIRQEEKRKTLRIRKEQQLEM